jgi:hypothetical protein
LDGAVLVFLGCGQLLAAQEEVANSSRLIEIIVKVRFILVSPLSLWMSVYVKCCCEKHFLVKTEKATPSIPLQGTKARLIITYPYQGVVLK